jgi:hypothetical protein
LTAIDSGGLKMKNAILVLLVCCACCSMSFAQGNENLVGNDYIQIDTAVAYQNPIVNGSIGMNAHLVGAGKDFIDIKCGNDPKIVRCLYPWKTLPGRNFNLLVIGSIVKPGQLKVEDITVYTKDIIGGRDFAPSDFIELDSNRDVGRKVALPGWVMGSGHNDYGPYFDILATKMWLPEKVTTRCYCPKLFITVAKDEYITVFGSIETQRQLCVVAININNMQRHPQLPAPEDIRRDPNEKQPSQKNL